MTQPGSAIPPPPGWWLRTDRVGIVEEDGSYGWSDYGAAQGTADLLTPQMDGEGALTVTAVKTSDSAAAALSGVGAFTATAREGIVTTSFPYQFPFQLI